MKESHIRNIFYLLTSMQRLDDSLLSHSHNSHKHKLDILSPFIHLLLCPTTPPPLLYRLPKAAPLPYLGVDDGHQSGVHVCEGGGGGLRLLDGAAEQAAAPHHVLRQQLPHDDAQVRDVHLVDQTVDGLLERFPGQPLERRAVGRGGGEGGVMQGITVIKIWESGKRSAIDNLTGDFTQSRNFAVMVKLGIVKFLVRHVTADGFNNP